MDTTAYLLTVVVVAAVATFLTRALPFVLLYRWADHPLLKHLGRYLPPVLMVLLLMYALKDALVTGEGLWPSLAALSVVMILHLLLRNPLVSIMSGTGLFMFLTQSGLLV
ncbi:MAG: branched-chain amino acid transporter [Oceanospirillales bacterium]|uniref:Branched-subunit amino acid transport protein AzlD n=1 Tax=Marinobacterium halophilum TaxID=267374 RepID=A0A2P8F0F3_9GAMM|nr:AzlD domain-containing protein [Marinobacterium halophilum]MBR9829710.1 branched-chain amino acid transporter [Oceanospirillales bacterium]PSL15196.1 branched-subunit amino acid transport protein AzlD [Marinobacterium halophilum]